MTFNQLCSKIAKAEGKKSQVKIGDIREVMSLLTTLVADEVESRGYSESMWVIVKLVCKKAGIKVTDEKMALNFKLKQTKTN